MSSEGIPEDLCACLSEGCNTVHIYLEVLCCFNLGQKRSFICLIHQDVRPELRMMQIPSSASQPSGALTFQGCVSSREAASQFH